MNLDYTIVWVAVAAVLSAALSTTLIIEHQWWDGAWFMFAAGVLLVVDWYLWMTGDSKNE